MPEYKRQHYLPAVYLQQLSADGPSAKRTSPIWRLDNDRHVKVPVESQCAEDHFYSIRKARETEEMFQQMEGKFGQFAKRIWANQNHTDDEFIGLILMMFDLHCRGIAYQNQTNDENIEAYHGRIYGLRNELIMGAPIGNVSDKELLNHIKTHWRVLLLTTTGSNKLITSDNPSIWFTLDDTNDLHLVVLPVTPYCCAVASDQRRCHISGKDLTETDQVLLNRHQVTNAINCIFSTSEFSLEQQEFVRKQWATEEKPLGSSDRVSWTVNFKRLREFNTFQFAERV